MEEHAVAAGTTFPWHEVYCKNSQKAVEFYTQALDFGTQEYNMGDGRTYKMLTRNGVAVGGIMETAGQEWEHVPPHWAVYLSVDDVDKRLAKCQELGATVVVPPMDIPNVGRMALISDPQGAHIWLYTPSEM
jgi:predicted enzyme related to lactoylglutathione lyase